MYQLTVSQLVPLSDDEKKSYCGSFYQNNPPAANEYKTVRVLDVQITDKEFQAIKKATLEVM